MPRTFLDISTSLDGFVAGPNPSLEHPLGEGGELLHEWAFRLAARRAQQGPQAGLLEEIDVHIAAVLLGGGTRLFDDLEKRPGLKLTNGLDTPFATHVSYDVERWRALLGDGDRGGCRGGGGSPVP